MDDNYEDGFLESQYEDRYGYPEDDYDAGLEYDPFAPRYDEEGDEIC